MTDPVSADREELIRRLVDRDVEPYVAVAPPFMLAKLRELAERYWREHPQASTILRMMASSDRVKSGTEPIGPAEPGARTRGRAKNEE